MQKYPTQFQSRTIWRALTGVSIGVLGVLLVAFIWLVGKVLGFLQPVIVPLAVAGIIAYLLDPVVRLFQKRGLSRLKAVIATFGAFLLIGTGLLAIVIPAVGHQVNEIRLKTSNTVTQEPRNFDERIIDALVQLRTNEEWTRPAVDMLLTPPVNESDSLEVRAEKSKAITDRLDKIANEKEDAEIDHEIQITHTTLWSYVQDFLDKCKQWFNTGGTSKLLSMLGLILGFFMVPIYLYYFLKDTASIREHWHDYVPLKASEFKTEVVETLTEINGYLISFFRGQVLVAFIDGILIGLALTAFGLPLGLLIGIMMAIVGIIPFVGNIITLIPACLIAWFHYSDPSNASIVGANPWANVAAVAAIFFIAQQINSVVTAPKIVGDSVGLHPMTVIFSMIFWSLILGGFIGALLAVPLTASIKVLFRRYIWEKKVIKAEEEPPSDDDASGSAEAEPEPA